MPKGTVVDIYIYIYTTVSYCENIYMCIILHIRTYIAMKARKLENAYTQQRQLPLKWKPFGLFVLPLGNPRTSFEAW